MAVNDPRLPVVWPRLHFALRVLGLCGLLAGLGILASELPKNLDAVRAIVTRPPDQAWPLYVCGGLVALALLAELASLLGAAAAMRRTATGLSGSLQLAIATLLFVGLNVWSFNHPWRCDWTRQKLFTLPQDLRDQLAKLDQNTETTVLVWRWRTGAADTREVADIPDGLPQSELLLKLQERVRGVARQRYDIAAERKVIEKVKDLAELLRDTAGVRLRVEVLDIDDEDIEARLEALVTTAPAAARALVKAKENTIFVTSRDRVRQMSFDELYLLDRVRSHDTKNLVLLGQGSDGRGIHPFVRCILDLEQKRPRVGVLVVHELLTTGGTDDTFSLAGLKKALSSHGFDTQDIVLKRGWDSRRLEPAADTFEESKLERLEAELQSVEEDIKDNREELEAYRKMLADLRPRPGEDEAGRLKELSAKYGGLVFGGRVTADARAALIKHFERNTDLTEKEMADQVKERSRLLAEQAKLDLDGAFEARRLTDVKAKLTYAAADCDMLLIPRLTRQSGTGGLIQPRLHSMSPEQADVVKGFLKAGKPVLACLGPITEPPGTRLPPEFGPGGPDPLEKVLSDLGFRLGKTTVLFPSDTKAFAERRTDILRQETPVETPPLDFSEKGLDADEDPRVGARKGDEHPLRRGLRVLANSAGGGLDLRLRFARPVYFEPRENLTEGTFLLTATGWNEDRPFPSRDWRPRYTPPKPDDPGRYSLEARRRGAFSVAAAAQVTIPESWLEERKDAKGVTIGKEKAAQVRAAVIGQGDTFNGMTLSPARERLLLQTANWLLARDDYLPTEKHPHAYPRLPYRPDEPIYAYYVWGARAALPLLFAFLGIVVLLYRRLR